MTMFGPKKQLDANNREDNYVEEQKEEDP